MAAVALLGVLLSQGRLHEHQELLEDRLADIIQVLGFQHRLVRALAAHRAGLTLRRPPP